MVQDKNLQVRIFKNRLLYIVVCVFSGLTAIPLLAILGEVLIKGWKQLTWTFLTEPTPNAFKAMMAMSAGEPVPGGIANGIIGTFLMLVVAAVIAIPVGIFCGICLSEYKGKWYLFHHDSVPSGGRTWLRSLKVCELQYDEEGRILPIEGLDE